jgi:hypothetical protein
VVISSVFMLQLPTLSQENIADIASGRHQLDAFVRRYIHESLFYRFVMLPDGATAYGVEAAKRRVGARSSSWHLRSSTYESSSRHR